MSFLSMRHFYLDRTRVTIGSKNTNLMRLHEQATFTEFENCFAYKFCSQLRNYAQHVGLPITGLNASGSHNHLNGISDFKFQLNFVKSELLARKSIWKSSIRSELEAMSEQFEVLPLANELMHAMDRVRRKTLKAYRPYFNNDLKIVEKVYEATLSRKGLPCIFWAKEVYLGKSKADIQMTVIPVELINIGNAS